MPTRRQSLLIAAWAAAVASLFVGPDDAAYRVRVSIWVAVAGWAIACGLALRARNEEWGPESERVAAARWTWGLAWVAFAVHVAFAFAYVHGWSHADVVRQNEAQTGFGEGVWVSYFFTLLWGLDAAWWWIGPASYARRPRWVGWAVHGFLAFIVFNGTVVFASGVSRWGGAAAFAILGGLWSRNVLRGRRVGG